MKPQIDGYSKLELAIYVCSMLKGLHRMARDHEVLSRIIWLAYMESIEIVKERTELEKIREE